MYILRYGLVEASLCDDCGMSDSHQACSSIAYDVSDVYRTLWWAGEWSQSLGIPQPSHRLPPGRIAECTIFDLHLGNTFAVIVLFCLRSETNNTIENKNISIYHVDELIFNIILLYHQRFIMLSS